MSASLVSIYRYPVKGMTAEPLERVRVEAGRRLPGDRRFAIAHASGLNLEPSIEWRPKSDFLMLARDERLALLRACYDPTTGVLTLSRDGKQVARGNLHEALGRTLIEQFFAAFMRAELRGAPKLVEAREGALTDTREPWVSVINLASVRDLEERILRKPIDPLRFRANLYIDGVEPWRELDWVGRAFSIGDVQLRAAKRIGRCAATNVDPATASRDLNIPLALRQGTGRADMGIYAEVITGGELVPGDAVGLPDSASGG
ncbi:MAG TPA: MOSC domain-containing protein [Alphaproteobacteria bacterium]|nr:MOSC domain-containing protein [Alphaproteobacteria bacterium]